MTKASAISEEFTALQAALEAIEPLEPGRRQFVIEMMLKRLGMGQLDVASLGPRDTKTSGAGGGTSSVSADGPMPALKEFVRQKDPQTDVQRYACLAYYLVHSKKVDKFKNKEIAELNVAAGQVKFANISVTANNAAKQNRFICSAGEGFQRLTIQGETAVEALPDQTKVKELSKTQKRGGRPRKAAAKRKASKKKSA